MLSHLRCKILKQKDLGKNLPVTLKSLSLERVKTETGTSQKERLFLHGTIMVTLLWEAPKKGAEGLALSSCTKIQIKYPHYICIYV